MNLRLTPAQLAAYNAKRGGYAPPHTEAKAPPRRRAANGAGCPACGVVGWHPCPALPANQAKEPERRHSPHLQLREAGDAPCRFCGVCGWHTCPYSPYKQKRKYHNVPTGGHASKKEHARAVELRWMEKSGTIIRNLREQVPYELIKAQDGERSVVYIADFVYEEMVGHSDGFIWREVVEDCKSPATRTPAYVIKRKLMLYVLGIRVRET